MSTFSHILAIPSPEPLQIADTKGHVAHEPVAGIFEDLMAQALSPVPKGSAEPNGQVRSAVEGSQPETGAVAKTVGIPANFLGKIPPSHNLQLLRGHMKSLAVPIAVPVSKQSSIISGIGKSSAQSGAKQVSDLASSQSDKRSDEPKLAKQSPAGTHATVADLTQSATPVFPLIAEALSAANLISKTLSNTTPAVVSDAAQATAAMKAAVSAGAVQSKQGGGVVARISSSDLEKDQTPPLTPGNSPAAVAGGAILSKMSAAPAKEASESISFESAAETSVKGKSSSESEQKQTVDSDGLDDHSTPEPRADIDGMSVAQQDTTVKQAEKTNNIAGQTEKVLPGNSLAAAQASMRTPDLGRPEQIGSTSPNGAQSPDSLTAAATVAVHGPPGIAASVASTVDRVQEMMTLNAQHLSDSGDHSVQVVIKPDAGTQLSLELRRHGAGVEVQAVLQQGNFSHLSQQWPDLQQRLSQRGIHLAPLASDGSGANTNAGETFQRREQRQTAEEASELSLAGLPAAPAVPVITHTASQRGWETWA